MNCHIDCLDVSCSPPQSFEFGGRRIFSKTNKTQLLSKINELLKKQKEFEEMTEKQVSNWIKNRVKQIETETNKALKTC